MPSQCFSLVLEAPRSLQSQVVCASRVFLLVYDDVLMLSAVGKTQVSCRNGQSSTGTPHFSEEALEHWMSWNPPLWGVPTDRSAFARAESWLNRKETFWMGILDHHVRAIGGPGDLDRYNATALCIDFLSHISATTRRHL